jgi:hypothetical protein
MGLEYRNGNPYYYMKTRENGRVVSKYMGAGSFARDLAALEGDRIQATEARPAAPSNVPSWGASTTLTEPSARWAGC